MSRHLPASIFAVLLVLAPGCNPWDPPSTTLELSHQIGSSKELNAPRLVVGATPERLLAVLPGTDPPELLLFDADGAPAERMPLPGLGRIHQLLSTAQGAIVIGSGGLQHLDAQAQPAGPPITPDPGWALVGTWIVQGDTLVGIGIQRPENRIHVLRMDLQGQVLGHTNFAPDRRPDSASIAPLSDERVLLAWTGSGFPVGTTEAERQAVLDLAPGELRSQESFTEEHHRTTTRIELAILDRSRGLLVGPATVYTPAPGGVLHSCSLQGRPGGGATLAWRDSTPGSWSLITAGFDESGILDPPHQVHPRELQDMLDQAFPPGGAGQWVSWGHGIHWGLFARRGVGSVALKRVDGSGERLLFEAPGSVESHAAAILDERVLVVAGAQAEEGYQVWSGVFALDR